MHAVGVEHQVGPEIVHIERSDRGGEQRDVLQHLVEGLVGGELVRCKTGAPETLLVEPDVPVGEIVSDEILDQAARQGDVVILIGGNDSLDQGIEPADDPLVELGPDGIRHLRRRDVELVDVGIKREHRITVIERAEELAADLDDTRLVELEVIPGLGVGEHIPAQGIGAVGVKRLERIDGVAETLGHLVTVLVKDKAVGDHALEGGSAADHRMDGVEGVEPSAGLVDAFGDEVCRAAELGAAKVAQAFLGVRHRAGVEPYVDEVALADHLLPAVADKEDIVDVRPVEVYLVVILKAHISRVETLVGQRIGGHNAGLDGLLDLVVELLDGAYAFLLLAVLGAPDRERCAPIAAAAEVPVLDVLEPFAETAGTRGFGFPGDLLIESHHLLAHSRGLDEPGVQRVIEHRLVGTPAMWICMDVLLDPEGLALGLEHHAEVDVERRVVRTERGVVGILDEAAGELGIVRAHPLFDVLRVEVFDAVETALVVHLSLRVAVAVYDH